MKREDLDNITWPVTITIPVQWGDMDAFQHVNNTVYLRWFESARIAFFLKLGQPMSLSEDTIGPILAHSNIDYRLPIKYPDTAHISVGISRIGTTSFTTVYKVLTDKNQDHVVACGEGIIVMFDYQTQKPIPISDDLRKALKSL